MPIDETKSANSLLAQAEELSLIDHQNRQGMRYETIRDLSKGYITILAVASEGALEKEQYADLLDELKSNYGVESVQAVFSSEIPENNGDYQYDLYLSAHLRIDPRRP